MSELEFLNKLQSLGVYFCAADPEHGGFRDDEMLKPPQLFRLIELGVTRFWAEYWGVSVAHYEQWRAWHASQGTLCTGTTKTGKPCGNGGCADVVDLKAADFVHGYHDRCHVHQEPLPLRPDHQHQPPL